MKVMCTACEDEIDIPEELIAELDKEDEVKFFGDHYINYEKQGFIKCPNCEHINGMSPFGR